MTSVFKPGMISQTGENDFNLVEGGNDKGVDNFLASLKFFPTPRPIAARILQARSTGCPRGGGYDAYQSGTGLAAAAGFPAVGLGAIVCNVGARLRHAQPAHGQ